MILLISSKIAGVDIVADIISSSLQKLNLSCVVLNPHDLMTSECSLIQKGSRTELVVKGKTISPIVIYMANQWRCDSIIRIPSTVDYPAAFRSRIQQFMQDIRFAFENVIWIPGKYESIERADSKPALMKFASDSGLTIPTSTINSFVAPTDSDLYRKNLGFPFIVSLNKKKGSEVGVTTTNTLHDSAKYEIDGEVWQWQSAIESIGQIRSFIVGETIWSVIYRKVDGDNEICDFRQVNQVEKKQIIWEPFELPQQISVCLLSLIKHLGLTVSAPEFLITKTGELIFIDMNPCGDWYGFFNEETNCEIVSALVKHISSQL